jgi:hypothetical protein
MSRNRLAATPQSIAAPLAAETPPDLQDCRLRSVTEQAAIRHCGQS